MHSVQFSGHIEQTDPFKYFPIAHDEQSEYVDVLHNKQSFAARQQLFEDVNE